MKFQNSASGKRIDREWARRQQVRSGLLCALCFYRYPEKMGCGHRAPVIQAKEDALR